MFDSHDAFAAAGDPAPSWLDADPWLPPPDDGARPDGFEEFAAALGEDRAAAETLFAGPGPDTAAALLRLDVRELGPAARAATVASWRRQSSWADAHAARAAAALAECAEMQPEWPEVAGDVRQKNLAGLELAMTLGVSRRAGDTLVELGQALDGPLWPTGDALQSGEIDEQKARVVHRALREVSLPVAAAVQDVVLPTAGRRTPTQLAADLQRALIEVDPLDADLRHERAQRDRCVRRPVVRPDGMAGLYAVLPAHAAMAMYSRVDGVARAARSHGDERTLDQLRADVLAAAVLGDVTDNGTDNGTDSPTAGASTGAPAPGRNRDSAGDGVPSLHDLLARHPVDVRVLISADHLLDGSENAATPTDASAGTPPAGASSAGTPSSRTPAAHTPHVYPPAPHVDGFGAVPPLTARALARGGVWRRIVTDPLSGSVLDVGRTRYRPPAAIADHVRLRDGTCVRPGCSAPAHACDLDHRVAWEDGGATSVENLAPLCRADHLAKTHGGHGLQRDEAGGIIWTTPAGVTHREALRPRGRALSDVSSTDMGPHSPPSLPPEPPTSRPPPPDAHRRPPEDEIPF